MPSSRPRIRCLGVGPGWPCAERNGSSFLYDWNGARWLCDCGEPTAHRLKAAGIPLESIDQVFISHLHFDHIGGLFMFLQGCWVEHRARPLTIRLPGHGIPAIREMLRQGFIFPALLPFPIDWRAWEDEPSVNLAGVGVTVHPTTHLARLLRDYPAEMPTGAAHAALPSRRTASGWRTAATWAKRRICFPCWPARSTSSCASWRTFHRTISLACCGRQASGGCCWCI